MGNAGFLHPSSVENGIINNIWFRVKNYSWKLPNIVLLMPSFYFLFV